MDGIQPASALSTTRLVLVCHAATSATRRAAFPMDEPVESPPSVRAERCDLALTAPETRCRQTAAALGLDAAVDERLRDRDHGAWAGRTLDELPEPDVTAWLTDPDFVPPSGESATEFVSRVHGWLDERAGDGRKVVAVTTPSVVRAAVVCAIRATQESFWRIDVAPLSRTLLSNRGGMWTLRSLAAP
jgi:broad specificity phosphatase PhoE